MMATESDILQQVQRSVNVLHERLDTMITHMGRQGASLAALLHPEPPAPPEPEEVHPVRDTQYQNIVAVYAVGEIYNVSDYHLLRDVHPVVIYQSELSHPSDAGNETWMHRLAIKKYVWAHSLSGGIAEKNEPERFKFARFSVRGKMTVNHYLVSGHEDPDQDGSAWVIFPIRDEEEAVYHMLGLHNKSGQPT